MPVDVVVGAHWGDEGKGKIAAALSTDAHACARFQGGPNAGHTVVLPTGATLVLRSLPSGLAVGSAGVIGGGCVVNPAMLLDEISTVEAVTGSLEGRLVVSSRAHVITDEHLATDRGGGAVGSTRMGVGPAYAAKMQRSGVRMGDLVGPGEVPGVDPSLRARVKERLSDAVQDERPVIRGWIDAGLRVVAEGAQGARLDIDHGDYPFVTSSNTTVGAALTGLGLGPRDIDRVLLVTPTYVTKVGGGTLPHRLSRVPERLLRQRGNEVDGATGSVRDVARLDLRWLRAAAVLNQATGIILTKVDVFLDDHPLEVVGPDGDVVCLPWWTEQDAAAPLNSGPIRRFVALVEQAVGAPVVAVSHGPAVGDLAWT